MRSLSRVVCTLVVLSAFHHSGHLVAQEPDALKEIDAKIEALRTSYEKRIQDLEGRVVLLEKENTELKRQGSQAAHPNSGDVANLEQRIVDLESGLRDARKAGAEAELAMERAQQHDVALDAILARSANLRTETNERYRDYAGFPFDPMKLYDLPRRFEFHGYLRAGFGLNGREGEMVAFKAPGAQAKYRLGNEAETYGELEFVHNWLNEDKPLEKPYVSTHVMLGYVTGQNDTEESLNAQDLGNDIMLRQAYVIAGNVIPGAPDVRFWGGQRYYQRQDIHINDFYFLDTSGYGGGVENVALGDFAKLHFAWLGGSYDRYVTDSGNVAKHNFDLRLSEIKVPGGRLMLWFDYARTRGGEVLNVLDAQGESFSLPTSSGWAVGAIHRTGEEVFLGGYNQLTVQYGTGAAYNFETTLDTGTEHLDDARHFRVTDHFTIEPSPLWSIQMAGIYDRIDYGEEDSTVEWISAGIRPILHITDTFGIAFETGVDFVDNELLDVDDYLWKNTLSLQLSRGRKFFDRPVLRAYVTYAKWGDEFRGHVGGPPYQFATDGLTFGLQVESWW